MSQWEQVYWRNCQGKGTGVFPLDKMLSTGGRESQLRVLLESAHEGRLKEKADLSRERLRMPRDQGRSERRAMGGGKSQKKGLQVRGPLRLSISEEQIQTDLNPGDRS